MGEPTGPFREESREHREEGVTLRILLVDDEPVILECLTSLLTMWGHSVLTFHVCTVEEAKGVLLDASAFPFDVAIIGTVMPGINGMELAELVNRISPATVLILGIEDCCIECASHLMERGLFVHPLPAPFEQKELKDALSHAVSPRHANGLVHHLRLPKETFRLEEINLPKELAESLVGQHVCVDVLREEKPATRRVAADEVPLLIDAQGNYWNDYRPFRVLHTDEQGRVWRFRKIWFPGLLPQQENLVRLESSLSESHVFREALSLPTEWDLWEINIPWETAHMAGMRQVEVEVHPSADHPPKVFWHDPSGSVWRIPNDWRKRLIELPESDILVRQGIPNSIARAYGGQVVTVNYHPGSLCCLQNQYRFRDDDGKRWPVQIADCSVLGYGERQPCETHPPEQVDVPREETLTEQQAASYFVRCMLEESARGWPSTYEALKGSLGNKFVLEDEKMASFDWCLAAISLGLQGVKNAFPLEQASRIENWILTDMNDQWAIDEVKQYEAAFQKGQAEGLGPLGGVPGRLLHRWLGKNIGNCESEILGKKTGFIEVRVMLETERVLTELAVTWSWKKIRSDFNLVPSQEHKS